MDLKKCSVCGFCIYPGHGSVLVKNNLKIFRFCRSRCRKLYALKKNPIFLKWTSVGRTIRGLKVNLKNNFLKNDSNSFLFMRKNYNFLLGLQTLHFYKKLTKIKYNRKFDFKIQKQKNKRS
ncbi:rpl24 (nucleomorph) [Hemiselmis andersenii]|uniref:Rpl24 n=1 Tax=Hemiselmis andersenii TaxID=464988 RepID=A9BKM6_HEMAN|nr:rpl24 [Hemiselmis andersenii]ABW98031.1 rpl24 [Hemiselmis andersenii]|mmetsp:Transcript_24548/g.56891  ORF Transcript_24548/g.56891 Transcript_24548/m.56891 type:complete len:121 (-) Transcript_24548:1025-1387(-)